MVSAMFCQKVVDRKTIEEQMGMSGLRETYRWVSNSEYG